MNFKKWVKSIQTAGYNGARTVNNFFLWKTYFFIIKVYYYSLYKVGEERLEQKVIFASLVSIVESQALLSTLQKVIFFARLQIFFHAGYNFLPPEQLPPHAKNDEGGY